MPDALTAAALPAPPPALLPRPPYGRDRTQLEAFLVLRRNPLELWGPMAYERDVLEGRFLGRAQLLLNDPEAIRHVLVANHENYRRNDATHRVLRPVLGEGLFLAEGEAWKRSRRTVAPALAPRAMPLLARHVVAATEAEEATLGRAADSGRPVELARSLQRLALEVAGRSMFSVETAAYGAPLRAMLERYGRGLARPGLLDLVLPGGWRSPQDRARDTFRRDWLKLMDRIIAAREARGPTPDGEPRDLFDLLAAARDPETGEGFTRAQLRDEVATLILAGHETTAVALFWSLLAASRMPEQQEALAAEARAADLSGEGAARAVATSLPRTRAHLDEALRLYPPAFLVVREAVGPDVVAGRRIAAGTVVSVSPWVLHRHRALWREPEAFDPARFLPGAPKPARYAYLPFGAGPRVCVGAQFAATEAVVVLARLLRAFRVVPFAGADVRPVGMVTTQPDRPVRFLLERRRAA